MVTEMRKLKNVRLLSASNAPATNEDNTIVLHLDLEQFVGLAVDYGVSINKAEGYKMAMKPYLARYIAAGYTSISGGAKGKGQPPKPKDNELSYTEIKGLFDAKCANNTPPIEYSKDATASGKSPYSNALNQFIQNFKLALQTGEWGNNSSRDKQNLETTAETKEKSKRGTRETTVIDVEKIAESLNKKLSRAQTIKLMELLCTEISDKNTTFEVVQR
jgi:hypothetical protein